MAFIRLTDEEGLTVHVVVGCIAYVADHPLSDDETIGSEIGFSGGSSLYFKDTPSQILAAIAVASGGAVDEADRVSGTMLRAALDVFQRAKIPVPSTLVLEDAIAAALRARQP